MAGALSISLAVIALIVALRALVVARRACVTSSIAHGISDRAAEGISAWVLAQSPHEEPHHRSTLH
jgi:hypothetical protein